MRFRCAACGGYTTDPVVFSPDIPFSPLWCHECAYAGIPAYRAFIDQLDSKEEKVTNEEISFVAEMIINAGERWPISPTTRVLVYPKTDKVVVLSPSRWPSDTHYQEQIEMEKFRGSTLQALIGYGSETETLILTRPYSLGSSEGE